MGYPRNRITLEEMQKNPRKKRYARIDEAAQFYSMGINSFREIAKEAKAILHIRKIALVDMERTDKYLELFYDEE